MHCPADLCIVVSGAATAPPAPFPAGPRVRGLLLEQQSLSLDWSTLGRRKGEGSETAARQEGEELGAGAAVSGSGKGRGGHHEKLQVELRGRNVPSSSSANAERSVLSGPKWVEPLWEAVSSLLLDSFRWVSKSHLLSSP